MRDFFQNIQTIGRTQKEYPAWLKPLPDVPQRLYCRGHRSTLHTCDPRYIAVVGTRRMSEYGAVATEKIVKELVSGGYCIVSGLAFGIDAYAHTVALQNHGKTIAVIASGIEYITPVEHESLAKNIVDAGGCVLSESLGFVPAQRWQFAKRNRIIAGMCAGVVVVEAGERSGSSITAHWATEYGRPVFAVSGPCTSAYAEGTKNLINNGAKLITSARDIFDELNDQQQKKQHLQEGQRTGGDPIHHQKQTDEDQVFHFLQSGGQGITLQEILERLPMKPTSVQSNLIELELQGRVRKIGWKYFAV